MASIVPPSTCEPLEQPRDDNADTISARRVGSSKKTEQREQTTRLSASAINKTRWPGSGNSEVWFGKGYEQLSLGLLTMVACAITSVIIGASAQGWTKVLPMIACASAGTFSGHRAPVLVLVLSPLFMCTEARAVPPYPLAQGAGGSDTGISPDIMGKASAPSNGSDSKTPGISWSTWVTVGVLLIGVVGGVEGWKNFKKGPERLRKAMFYICVFTLVIAAAPVMLHQAGGIETEVVGPLWALWAVAHLNFVLRGALLLRNEKIGYLSPLAYIGILAILSPLVFSAAGDQSSRLWTTVATSGYTIVHYFALRAAYGGPQPQEAALIR